MKMVMMRVTATKSGFRLRTKNATIVVNVTVLHHKMCTLFNAYKI